MFTFSIRDILLCTVIAAVASAWGVDHARQAATIETWEKQLAPTADFDFAFSQGGNVP
jgi:hypothetical protein